ncbi:NAD(P)H-binding protein [Streptomyces gamaensis]|uniref:NAD(P)H-binding protein n=1 Tax=Streptomyces gamaensis TaxID=1763542 RepID=A0ABW0ZD80_9ACTN
MTEILVTGATGKTGSRVVPRLKELGHSVRAASRSSATPFDWADPSTWQPALTGAEAVYFVPTELLGLSERAAFVDEARKAGVRRIVQLSVRGLDTDGTVPGTEAAVRDSGLEWTMLRPCWFAQDFAAPDFFLSGVRSGDLKTPAGDGREPFIDAEDIADVAVAALTRPVHVGKAYDLSGPRSLTFTEALTIIGTATGRTLHHQYQHPDDYTRDQIAHGHPADEAAAIAAFLDQIRQGKDDYVSTGVEDVLGRAARTFEDYVKTTAATGIWT